MATSSSRISRMGPVFIGSTPISLFNSLAFAVSRSSSSFLHRSPSPTHVDLKSVPAPSPRPRPSGDSKKKRGCMCAPTTHPGSFRCSLHRIVKGDPHSRRGGRRGGGDQSRRQWNRFQRWALTNTLVRSGAAKEEWEKRAVEALMRRPSSSNSNPLQKPKDRSFQPRPSRLSIMSKAEE